MRIFVSLMMAVLLAACADKPYKITEVVLKKEIPIKTEPYALKGMVEVGTPIYNATVEAFAFENLSKGVLLAKTVNNHDGAFEIVFETAYSGPVLLESSGGLYKDLATGEVVALKPGQRLSSVITHIKMPEKTNINAWTTLATARVQAQQGFWDQSVARLKDTDRIDVDFSQVSYLLTGKTHNYINIRRQELFDIEKGPMNLDDSGITLYLTHGGLSQLAKRYSSTLSNEGTIVSVIDLIGALSEDLSDRIFDGRDGHGGVVHLGQNRRIELNSYTVRKDLSESVYRYAEYLNKTGKASESDLFALRSPGKLVDSIAAEARPEFFSQNEKPLPFDVLSPKIQIRFAGDHHDSASFATLAGDVFFQVKVIDDSPAEIVVVAPQLAKVDDKGVFGVISNQDHQDALGIAKACSQEASFHDELKKRGLRLDSVNCACFKAIDSAGNSHYELGCFQREGLKSRIESPVHEATLIRADLRQGVSIKSSISSGVPLKECQWLLYNRGGREPFLTGHGLIDGTRCTIDHNLNGDQLPNGGYTVFLHAKDFFGRYFESPQRSVFNVRHDMITLPDRGVRK